MVHGQQAEHVVVELGDRLARPVLVGRTDLELLVAATELHPTCSFVPAGTCWCRPESATRDIPAKKCLNTPWAWSGARLRPTYAAGMSGLRTGVAEESTPESRTPARAPARPTKTPAGPPPGPASSRSSGTLAITVLWAWLVTVVLDASNFPSPLHALTHRTFDAPALLPSVMVVWVFVILVLALIGRLWVSLGVVTALTALLGAVNATKLELRNDPVVPSDLVFLGQPGFLFDMVPKSKLLMGALGLVAVVLLAWGFGWLVAKLLPRVSTLAAATWRDRPARDPGAGRGDLPRPARPRQQLQREGQPLAGGVRLDRPALACLGPAGELPAQRVRRRPAVQHPRHRDGRARGLLEGGRRGDRRALPGQGRGAERGPHRDHRQDQRRHRPLRELQPTRVAQDGEVPAAT